MYARMWRTQSSKTFFREETQTPPNWGLGVTLVKPITTISDILVATSPQYHSST